MDCGTMLWQPRETNTAFTMFCPTPCCSCSCKFWTDYIVFWSVSVYKSRLVLVSILISNLHFIAFPTSSVSQSGGTEGTRAAFVFPSSPASWKWWGGACLILGHFPPLHLWVLFLWCQKQGGRLGETAGVVWCNSQWCGVTSAFVITNSGICYW